jgi:hypothetical protein
MAWEKYNGVTFFFVIVFDESQLNYFSFGIVLQFSSDGL